MKIMALLKAKGFHVVKKDPDSETQKVLKLYTVFARSYLSQMPT